MWRSTWLLACALALAFGGCSGKVEAGATDGGAGHAGTGGSGGSGASAGTGGVSSGGTGGVSSGGTGGSTCSTGTAAPPACGTALCGNAKVDTCNDCPDGGWGGYPPGGPGGPACQNNAEDCDGSALGGESCTSLGFSGGTLGCTTACRFDTAACARCVPPGGHLTACDESVASAKAPTSLAIAATAQEIGLAWISRSSGGPQVWFARFKPDLSLIGKSGPVAANCPSQVALAVRPGGWVLATSGYGQAVELFAIDATGKVTQEKTVAAEGRGAVFGERQGGSPLLVWIEQGSKSLGAAVVSADGISTSPPVSIPMPGGLVDSFVSSAFVGDGFLVAARASNRVVVGRVSGDGSTTGTVTQPVPDNTEVPALASTGSEARMVYEHFNQPTITMEMVRLDKSGKALASPVVIGSAPDYYNNAYPVADGADTLVVMGSYTGTVYQAKHLDVVRVDGSGKKIWGPQTIATDPTMLTGYGAVMSGTGLVSAFIEGGSTYPVGLGLARMTP